MLIRVAPLSISKEKKAKKQQKGPQFISRIYNFNIPPLKVLPFYMQELCWQFTAFANYSPLEILGRKIKIEATKVTLLALFSTHSVTSFQRKMHVFVCVEEENEKSYTEGTGFRGQINNGLLTATLLPVICMQRSAEKVNVQKDTNSTIISRPENTLHHTLRH